MENQVKFPLVPKPAVMVKSSFHRLQKNNLMNQKFVAKAEITVNASKAQIWEALTNPEIIKQYFFGSEVVSDWKVGSSIIWKGIWKEKPYEDKGTILKVEPEKLLQYTHFSSLSGVSDVPENYHTLTYELLSDKEDSTHVILSQDNNASKDEMKHSQQMWETMLDGLKKVLEK